MSKKINSNSFGESAQIFFKGGILNASAGGVNISASLNLTTTTQRNSDTSGTSGLNNSANAGNWRSFSNNRHSAGLGSLSPGYNKTKLPPVNSYVRGSS
jgi:hypothetical protein